MLWTHEQRMDRAIRALEDKGNILSTGASEIRHRPRFFNKYAFRVSACPTIANWSRFDEIKQMIQTDLDPYDVSIVAHRQTYDFHIYGNDPSVVRWFARSKVLELLYVSSVIQTHRASWGKPLPKSNRKGKFFGQYRYRVRMKPNDWGEKQENVDQLAELEMNNRVLCRVFSNSKTPLTPEGVTRDTHIYVDKLNEVLVLKLLFGDQVAEVTERS